MHEVRFEQKSGEVDPISQNISMPNAQNLFFFEPRLSKPDTKGSVLKDLS